MAITGILDWAPARERRRPPRRAARNGRVRIVSSSPRSASSDRSSGGSAAWRGEGVSPSGHSESAPATSAPSSASNPNVFPGETPRAAATASRCAPSGSRPSKKGRHSRVLKDPGRFGSENDTGGAESSATQSEAYANRRAPCRLRPSEPTTSPSHQTVSECVMRRARPRADPAT